MVIAITVGILLASLLFMKELAAITRVVEITNNSEFHHELLPANWKIFKIRGALFFAAADRGFGELAQHAHDLDGIILHMRYSILFGCGWIGSY